MNLLRRMLEILGLATTSTKKGQKVSRSLRQRAYRQAQARKLFFEQNEERVVLASVSAAQMGGPVTEGSPAIVSFNLSQTVMSPVTVNYQTVAGTAAQNVDYQGVTGSVTIGPGQSSATVSVGTLVDSLAESSETFSVTITSASGATIGTASATITINDGTGGGGSGTVSVAPLSSHYSEGTAAGFRITRSVTGSGSVTVNYQTVAGTAIQNTDYQGTSGTVTIPANQSYADVSVTTLNDFSEEQGETFSLQLMSATGATVNPSQNLATVTIDDVPFVLPTITVANGSVVAGALYSPTISIDTGTAGGNFTYLVDWGDGATATYGTSNPPSHTYVNSESYTIAVAALWPSGPSASTTATVIVTEPQASIDLDDGIAEAQEADEPGKILAFTEDGDKSNPVPIAVSFTTLSPVTDSWTITFTFSSNLLRLYRASSAPGGMTEIASGTQFTTLTAPHLVYAAVKDPPVAGMGSVTATLHTPGGQNVSDIVTVSVVKIDLDPAAWTSTANEPKEMDPGIVVPLDQMSVASHQAYNLPVNVSSGVAGNLIVANTSLFGVAKPHIDFDESRLVIKDYQGQPIQSGVEVDFGATLNIAYANRVSSADEQGGQSEVNLIFDDDVVDTTIVHWTALKIEKVPSYLFGQATYAAPIEFLVPGMGTNVTVSDIRVELYDSSATSTMYGVGQWDVGDRWVNGDGTVSTGSVDHSNNLGNQFTGFLPNGGLASIYGLSQGDYSQNTWFSMTAKVTSANGTQLVLGSIVSPGAGGGAKPLITYSSTVEAIDLGKDEEHVEQKTVNFNIHRTGDTHFGRAFPDSQGNAGEFIDSSAMQLVSDDFTYAEASASTVVSLDAHARLADHETFGGTSYGDAMAISDEIGGYIYFSYGGRDVPGILGSGERAMALDLNEGTAYNNIFDGSKVTIQVVGTSSDATAYSLSSISAAAGIGWALAPGTGPVGPIFGVLSSLASLAAANQGQFAGDKAASARLQPFDLLVMPNGTVLLNDAFQPIAANQTNTPFGMKGERVVYAGSRMARYVVAAAEVTVKSYSNPFFGNDASADVQLAVGTNPSALTTFTVKTWIND